MYKREKRVERMRQIWDSELEMSARGTTTHECVYERKLTLVGIGRVKEGHRKKRKRERERQ